MPDPGASPGWAAAEISEALGIPAGAIMTDEQVAEFRERFAATMEGGYQHRVIPREQLTLDEVRQLLRTCVTVVKPGEILFIRMGNDYTPNHLRELQELADWWLGRNAPDVKALVFPGDAAEVVRQTPDEEQPEGELARIDEILREHGFEYPLGARGVADLAAGYLVRQEALHELDPEHWAAPS